MQTRLEASLERHWAELGQALEQHQERHAERRAAVAKLRAKEEATYRVIAEQKRRTRLLHVGTRGRSGAVGIGRCRRVTPCVVPQRQIEEGVELVRMWDCDDDDWADLRALRHERDEFRTAYLSLRDAMNGQRQHDKKQMRHMVVLAEETLQRLQQTATRGEKVLTMACLCNTLEPADERQAYPADCGTYDFELKCHHVRHTQDCLSTRRLGWPLAKQLALPGDGWHDEFWGRGLVAPWGDVHAVLAKSESAKEIQQEGSHTCFTNRGDDLAAEVGDVGDPEGSEGGGGNGSESGGQPRQPAGRPPPEDAVKLLEDDDDQMQEVRSFRKHFSRVCSALFANMEELRCCCAGRSDAGEPGALLVAGGRCGAGPPAARRGRGAAAAGERAAASRPA